jgi:hypothetical protein
VTSLGRCHSSLFSVFNQHHSITASQHKTPTATTSQPFYTYDPQYQRQCIPLRKNRHLTGRTPHLVCIIDHLQVHRIDKLESRKRVSAIQSSPASRHRKDRPHSVHRYLLRRDYALHPPNGPPHYQTPAVVEERTRWQASLQHHLDHHTPTR